jgi:CRISPR-associated endonuclease/helicase Cas3
MKLFKKIEKEYDLNALLQKCNSYFAHIPIDKKDDKELLSEHISLVMKYFGQINDKFELENLIDIIIDDIIETNFSNRDKEKMKDFIKELFFCSLYFHDLGKMNVNFQYSKMHNYNCKPVNNSIGTTHSLLGAYLYIMINQKKIYKFEKNECRNKLLILIILISSTIVNHHKSFLQKINSNYFIDIEMSDLINYLKEINEQFSSVEIKSIENVLKNLNNFWDYFNFSNSNFNLFILIKLNYSLLTACDYLATYHYLKKLDELINVETISYSLKEKINSNIKVTKPYNKALFENLEKYRNLKVSDLSDFTADNLNLLRQKLSVSVIDNLKNNSRKLFYIETPTGSGKTNLSFIAANEILKNNNIKKIFYVFPFTTLITQTFQGLKETFLLNSDELAEIHSKASIQRSNNESEEYKESEYINYLFNNYPISLISHIKFFDILKSNDKQSNYLLFSLANSLIIIDELQSYPPKEWDKIIFFIYNFSKYLNIRFIVMSATLPRIDSISSIEKNCFIDLIPDFRDYYSNPNFNKRVEFDFSIFQMGIIDLEKVKQIVINKSEDYFNTHKTAKVVIEFLTKKNANEFINKYKNEFEEKGYKVYLLSGTILEPRRREIIEAIKKKSIENTKILLISTQVIEAGVDVDMDIGFKEISILDSEEQLAGRVNRNASKTDSVVYIFKLSDDCIIYNNDFRYKIGKELLLDDSNQYKDILANKNFNLFYGRVIKGINDKIGKSFIDNFSYYLEEFNKLNFINIDKEFELIENDAVLIFVPITIQNKIINKDVSSFNNSEINFLKYYNISVDNGINGEDVWKLYEKFIQMKEKDLSKKMSDIKNIYALLQKFSFSVFKYSSLFKELKNVGGAIEKYGFWYLNNYKDVYSFENGLKDLSDNSLYFF